MIQDFFTLAEKLQNYNAEAIEDERINWPMWKFLGWDSFEDIAKQIKKRHFIPNL